MLEKYDVIIVGGGIAGLTSAAYLCKYGYRTLLCEKSDKTGGLVNSFSHNGYVFDAGIRAFENSGILFPMLKSLEIDIEFEPNIVSIGIKNQWSKIRSRDNLEHYMTMLIKLFPENEQDILEIKKEIKKVINYMDVIYGIDNPLFLDDFRDYKYLVHTLLPWLFKYQINISKASKLDSPVNIYLKKFTSNHALIDMITQHFFKETPTFFALSYFGLYLDYCYPKGGTSVLPEKLTEYIKTHGGEIMTQAIVTQVNSKNKSVKLSNERVIQYKKMIWAADQRSLYKSLLNPQLPKVEKQKVLVKQSIGCDSILTLFLGVNLNSSNFENNCGAHAFYTPITRGLSSLSNWKNVNPKGTNDLLKWVSLYLERTTYEISCPVLQDITLAPKEKTGLIISTLMDYELVQYFKSENAYDDFKEFCTKKIISVLEHSIFPKLESNIEFSICSTPLTIEKETGNTDGAITGWSFTNNTMPSEDRFKKIANAVNTPIKNIYQCGQWSFSPSGLPISILTGKLAADQVKKSLEGSAKE